MRYRPDIDGLRALSIIPVLLYHLDYAAFSGGFVGVDVFFVISGYLITSIIREDAALGLGGFLLTFYERRVRRIFPALFAVVLASAALGYLLLSPPDLIAFADSTRAMALFVSNVYFYFHSSYFDAAARTAPLLHTWSLAVEEQYYVVFPPLFWLLQRRAPRAVPWVLAGVAAASLAFGAWQVPRDASAAFYLAPARAWELLVGALLALDWLPAPGPRWLREAMAWTGIAAIALAVFEFSAATPFPGPAALLPCLGAGLVVAAAEGSSAGRLLALPAMVFTGRISYSLYLWHWPAIVYAKLWLLRPLTEGERLMVIAGSVAMATLSWWLIERPVRARRGIVGRRALFAGAAALILVCGIFDMRINALQGLHKRMPPGYVADLDLEGEGFYQLRSCFLGYDQTAADWHPDQCVVGPGKPVKALLWGDSYAAHYMPALKTGALTLPFTLYQYSYSACAPALGYLPQGHLGCRDFNDHIKDAIAETGASLVIMSGRWEEALAFGMTLDQLARTVATVRALGVKVVVLGESPLFPNTAPLLYAWHQRNDPGGPLVDRDKIPPGFDATIRQAVLKGSTGGVWFLPTRKAFCDDRLCRFGEGTKMYVFDDGHFTTLGSIKALTPLVATLACIAETEGSRCPSE